VQFYIGDFIALLPDHHHLKTDWVILNRLLRQKVEKGMNSHSPLLLPAIEFYNFMGVPPPPFFLYPNNLSLPGATRRVTGLDRK